MPRDGSSSPMPRTVVTPERLMSSRCPEICGALGSLGFDGRNGVRVANLFAPERPGTIRIT